MKKIVLAASIAAIILALGACSKKPAQGAAAAGASQAQAAAKTSIDAIKARGKVRIGFFPDMPPWCSQGQDGKYTGYDVYFGHRIAKDLLGDENAIDYVPVDAASRVEFLKSDKVDIILANFTKTPERAEMVDFALPYMKTSIGVASPKSAPITSIDQLKGKTLISQKGTTAEMYFTTNYPSVTLLKFDQTTDIFNALKQGKGAAVTQDNTLLMAWVAKNPGFVLGIDSLGNVDTINPAVKKGNKALLDWLNDEIANKLPHDFFLQDYQAELVPFFGSESNPNSLVVENGKL